MEQHNQLKAMASGGLDTGNSIDNGNLVQRIGVNAMAEGMYDSFGVRYNSNPETILIAKQDLASDNPCVGCDYEFSTSDAVADYCHYHCKL